MEINDFFCNKCGCSLSGSQSPFSITNCGHIFCQKCLRKGGTTCARCKSQNIKSLILTQPLCPSVSALFMPILESFTQLGSAIKFQLGQHQSLVDRCKELDRKYEASKKAYWKLCDHMKRVTEEKEKLKAILAEKQEQRFIPGNGSLPANYGASGGAIFDSTPSNGVYPSAANRFRGAATPASSRSSLIRGYTTTDSESSASTIRSRIDAGSRFTADGFRVPTTNRVPRSAGSNSTASSDNVNSPFAAFKPFGSSNFFHRS